jgi:hypothetical protein
MTLDIGRAVSEGASRLTSRAGLTLIGAFLLVGVASTVAQQALNVAAFEGLVRAAEAAGTGPDAPFTPEQLEQLRGQFRTARQTSPLAVSIPALVAVGLVFVLALVAEAVTLAAVRTFAVPEENGLPSDATRRLPMATLNGFVGGFVVAVLVTLGLLMFVLPGLFLYVVFIFLRQEIAVGDRNFVDALAESYELTKGNRFQVLGLVVALIVVTFAGALPSTVLSFADLTLAGTVVGLLVSPLIAVFGVAVTTRAYVQLREADETTEDDEDEPIGALGPDDIPEA